MELVLLISVFLLTFNPSGVIRDYLGKNIHYFIIWNTFDEYPQRGKMLIVEHAHPPIAPEERNLIRDYGFLLTFNSSGVIRGNDAHLTP